MKKGCLILAVTAGLLGLFGGGCTFVASSCAGMGKALESPVKGKSSSDISKEAAELTTQGMGLSVGAILISIVGLVTGVLAGVVTGRGSSIIFGTLTIACGVGMLVTANFLSGPMMGIAGILGLIAGFQIKDNAAAA